MEQQKLCAASIWQQQQQSSSSSSTHPNQFSNAHHHHYGQLPQIPRRLTGEMIHNRRMLPNMPSVNNIGQTDVRTAFSSRLSGPAMQSHTDLQHSLNPVPIPCHDSLNYRTINDSSKERILSLLHSVLRPQKMDSQNMKYGEIVCPITLPNSTAVGHLNSSKLVQGANLNVEREQLAVAYKNPHVHGTAETFSSLRGNSKSGSHPDITASQKLPLESEFPVCSQECNPSGSFLRVSCSGISGNLLLSDSGILGVVCSCHGAYMSIARFSEHSGLYNVNPGNVIRMDNGESIAQWRKTFFSRHGIRVLEGYQGWDWLEGISAASGFQNHHVTSVLNSDVLLNHAAPSRTSVCYGQEPPSALNSKDHQRGSSFPARFPFLETEKASQAHNIALFRDLVSKFHGNLQHMTDEQTVEMSNIVARRSMGKVSHLANAEKINCHSSNVLFPVPDTQNLQPNSCSLFEVLGISSNVELRLRQPPGRTTLETRVTPAFRSDIDPHRVFTDHHLPKTNKLMEMQGAKSTTQVSDYASNGNRRSSQSDRSDHAGAPYGAKIHLPTCSVNQDVPLTVLNPLQSYVDTPQSNQQLTTTNYVANESHVIVEKMHAESHTDESVRVCFPQSRLAGNITEISTNLINAHNEVGVAVNGSLHKEKLPYPDSVGTSSSLTNGEDRILLGFSSGNSAFTPCNTALILSKKKGRETMPGSHSCNLKVPRVPGIVGQSTRNHFPASENARLQHQLQQSPNHQVLQTLLASKRDQGMQELPYAHVPEMCSYTVHSNFTAEKNKVDPDTCRLVNVGDGTASIMGASISRSNENCVLLKTKAKPFETIGNVAAQNTKRVESHYFQWRNVPRSTAGSGSSKQDQLAGSCNDEENLNSAAYAAKCFTTSSVVKSVQEHEISKAGSAGSGSSRQDQFAGSCNDEENPNSAKYAAKCLATSPVVKSVKEHDISYASSRCSAPEVIQTSIDISMKDSSAVDPRDMGFANVSALDEGSRSNGSFPPDAHDSASQTNLSRSSESATRKRSRSLIEEFRLQNLLMSNDARYHIQKNSTILEENDQVELESMKRTKTVAWKKCDRPFLVSGQSSLNNESSRCNKEVGQNTHSVCDTQGSVECEDILSNCGGSFDQKKKSSAFSGSKKMSCKRDLQSIHYQVRAAETEKNVGFDDDILAASGMLRMKRLRVNGALSTSKQIQRNCGSNAASNSRFTYGNGRCCKPVNSDKRIVRPIVFGKYGIISNGNPLRPEKILPLKQILKKIAHHSKRRDQYRMHNNKVKSASVKMKKMCVRQVKESSTSTKVLNGEAKAGKSKNLISIEFTTSDSSAKKPFFSATSDTDSKDQSYTLEKSEKCYMNHGSKPKDQLKKMSKTRKRNLSELLLRGKESEIVNSSLMSNPRSLCSTRCKNPNAIDCRCEANEMNKHIRCTSRSNVATKDASFDVCGGPDKDTSDHLLECSRFLIKKLLREEVEGVDLDNDASHRKTMLHSTTQSAPDNPEIFQAEGNLTCARTEGYKRRTWDNHCQESNGNSDDLVSQEQLNAWLHIQRQKPQRKGRPKLPSRSIVSDIRKAYACYKQSKGWTQLVVYKSSIHALGLYTSQFIRQGAMVVEYVGEIIGVRVADKREQEYHSGKRLPHKSACYFFRVDKEHIIDATRKGGIARFVNHSCLPNCVAKIVPMRSEKKVIFVAERDIYPGEEITYDYKFNHEDDGEKIPCYCKSKNCRRYLN